MNSPKLRLDTTRAADHLYHIHEYLVDVQRNHIWLAPNERLAVGAMEDKGVAEPGVEWSMATRFLQNLQVCMGANPGKTLLVHLKTNGGGWEEGMAIHDAIRAYPDYVTMLNYTHARSMSSLIFLAGDYRVMMPNSCFMFHQGTLEFSGTMTQFNTEHEWTRHATRTMLGLYADAIKDGEHEMSKWTRPRIIKYLTSWMQRKEECYLTAEQAVRYGFAHAIFNGRWDSLME